MDKMYIPDLFLQGELDWEKEKLSSKRGCIQTNLTDKKQELSNLK